MCRSRLWVLGKDTIGENIIGGMVNSQMVLFVANASLVPNSDRTFEAEYIRDEVVFSFDVFCTNEIFGLHEPLGDASGNEVGCFEVLRILPNCTCFKDPSNC